MASVLAHHEMTATSDAAEAVGGYEALLRLQEEREAIVRSGKRAQLIRDAQSGRYTYIAIG